MNITDQEIVEKWRQALRMHRKPSRLAKLIALSIADELEKDGVTEADIDRLFPERKALAAAPASRHREGCNFKHSPIKLCDCPSTAPTNAPEPVERLALARKMQLDAVERYNRDLKALQEARKLTLSHSGNVDQQYRDMNDANHEFHRIAREIADAALTTDKG